MQKSLYLVLLFPLLFCVMLQDLSQAQTVDIDGGGFNTVIVSGDQHPHWLVANRRGLVDSGEQFQNVTGMWMDANVWQSEGRSGNLSLGGELISKSGNTYSLYFQQLYAELSYRDFLLTLGRFEDERGIYMHSHSSGSMTLSRNATPIPGIRLKTDGYLDLPGTRGFMSAKVSYSDKFLESGRFVESARLHQKSLHLSVNIWRMRFIGGIDHHVMWGGNSPLLGERPGSFSDYLRVVFSQSAGEGSGATPSEQINRLGNTVASYDFGIDYYGDNYTFRIYRTFFIEDRPGMTFRSPLDGVWGIGFIAQDLQKPVNGFLYEHIYTITQDARGHVPKGRANYYNHDIYRSGWSYYNHALGNPFLTYDSGNDRFTNNMVVGHYAAITGAINGRSGYKLQLAHTRNYGLCEDRINNEEVGLSTCIGIRQTEELPDGYEEMPRDQFRRDQIYTALRLHYLAIPQRGIEVTSAIGIDSGDFSGNNIGFELGIRWRLDPAN